MKTIGIKLADGSFYPILEEGTAKTYQLDLTTVKDGQTKVQIDLYRSESGSMEYRREAGSDPREPALIGRSCATSGHADLAVQSRERIRVLRGKDADAGDGTAARCL